MQTTRTRAALAVILLGALGTVAGGQSADETLEVVRVKARFKQAWRTGQSRHQVKMTVRVSPRGLPYEHAGEGDALRLRVGGVELCDVAAGSDGYRVKKNGRWTYRGESAGGNVRVVGNGRSGKVKVKVTKAHLPDLRDSPARDLELELELAGTLLETSASFRVIDRGVRRWSGLDYLFPPRPGPGPNPGPDPDPRPAPTGAALRTAILADMAARGITFNANGPRFPAGGFDGMNKRCPSGALAEVVPLSSSPPGRTDRMSDTAYFCRHSRRYWLNRTGGYAMFNLWLGPYDLP